MPCEFLLVNAYENLVLAKVAKERLLDPVAINSLGDALLDLLKRHPKISLVIDLADVAYLSSSMLGKFVALYKAIRAEKGRVAIAGVRPALLPLFKVTGIDRLIEFHADAESAILLYKRKPL